ncbi:MAG: hypothetical protein LBH95_09005 [Oscillospiraceae bacterium]|jgi:hypothetical protein|nr:hypothetical protein [Oscillospiraceae bacterium]
MNINYHYFTVKTLAHYSGLNEQAAQYIAHFSQQVDNFIMGSPFIIAVEPPDFFPQNGLARKFGNHKWVFSPCPTGVNVISSVSHNYQLHTLMPFHFITPVSYNAMPENPDRDLYRCLPAGERDSLLVNGLTAETLRRADLNSDVWLMEFGMMLHTFADTYAHCYFSGFHGWENESYVGKMDHKQPVSPAIKPAEVLAYRVLPSIGHGNAGHAPDCCDCDISLYGKKDKGSPLKPFIERDNTAFFEDCSRRILELLCKAAGNPAPAPASWDALCKKIRKVHSLREPSKEEDIRKNWASEFPQIPYSYDKNEFITLRVELLYPDQSLMDSLNCTKDDLTNIFSEQGDQARAGCLVMAKDVNDAFFRYNELAYRRVCAVTGEYASQGSAARLSAYCDLAAGSLA